MVLIKKIGTPINTSPLIQKALKQSKRLIIGKYIKPGRN